MKRWSKEEEDKLKNLYPHKKLSELSIIFGRTKNAIANKCNKMKLKGRGLAWRKLELSPDEKLWFKINFPYMSNQIIGLKLNCGWRTVVRLAREMGLAKAAQFIKECQINTANKAMLSHIKNHTYPPKGYYSPNLQKGERFQFKKRHDNR